MNNEQLIINNESANPQSGFVNPAIAEQLTAVNDVKAGIRDALSEKGVDMSGVPFTKYPEKVAENLGDDNEYFVNFAQGANHITLPRGITSVGARVFENNTRLLSVNVPEGVTDIHPHAFENSRISGGQFPNSLRVIGYRAFAGTSLWDVRFGSEIQSINGLAFAGCPNLRSITINRQPNSVSGAPWGALDATIAWRV